MSSKPAEVARRAAEIIQERGICKGDLWDDDGRVCLWGALNAAQGELRSADFRLITDELQRRFPEQGRCYPGSWFNDEPATDERDIAKLLLSVADDLDFAGSGLGGPETGAGE